MAKLESSFKNMLLSLFGVTLIASAALGVVYGVTKEPIARAEANKQELALASVLPKYEKLGKVIKVLPVDGKDSIEIYPAYSADGEEIASAVKTYTYSGFSGFIEIMVGIDTEGEITGFQVLKHAETPGLGSKMNEWFSNAEKPSQNVIGRAFGDEEFTVYKDGGNVDAITAATITSRAFLDALNRAYRCLDKAWEADAQSGATNQIDDNQREDDAASSEQ
ncbi:MAG: RnfABCDGE type electron transport complex subunit G [Prolixibacteraceae bacterium]|nr:RnfABCDGE type electron transport complex subunit G [Prolixibacteraceae bacterium]